MATRRSGRARVLNKKYSVDAFEGLDLESSASETEQTQGQLLQTSRVPDDDDDDDDEFEEQDAKTAEAEEKEASFEVSSEEGDVSGEDIGNGQIEDDDNVSVSWSNGEATGIPADGKSQASNKGKKGPKGQRSGKDPTSSRRLATFDRRTRAPNSNIKIANVRGIKDIIHHQAKQVRHEYIFGPADEDVAPFVRARDRWFNQATLPTRKVTGKEGGFSHSFYYPESMREREVTQGWEWYHELGGKTNIKSVQISSNLSAEECQQRMPARFSQNTLLGPLENQRLFTIQSGSTMSLREAWEQRKGSTAKGRRGWMLNVGAKPVNITWVPNHSGESQYLAIAVDQKPIVSNVFKNPVAPGFHPEPSYSSSIQIWKFKASSKSGQESRPDMSQSPQLDAILFFDWGNARQIQWCPMPVRHDGSIFEHGHIHLGLLAGIWADGEVRVLDIEYTKGHSTLPVYVYMKQAAFACRPPESICTSVTWLSTSSIAAACANGCVAIWNLPSHLSGPLPLSRSNPQPWFYEQLHPTIILTIVSCRPSRPYIIVTSSMDGHLRLTDLRAPHIDTLFSSRSRVGQAPLVWSESCQSALNPDDNFAIRASPLRRFHATYTLARADSIVVDIAVSPVHPFLLMAGSNGDVTATNPLRRVLSSKSIVWQQVWFNHEWRAPVRSKAAAQSNTDPPTQQKYRSTSTTNGPDEDPTEQEQDNTQAPTSLNRTRSPQEQANVAPTTSEGSNSKTQPPSDILCQALVRISEGFKLETSRLLQQEGSLKNIEEGTVFTTIYEEETAVTCVAWNPNLRCGGWAAAGMGSGLVRVEDIALD